MMRAGSTVSVSSPNAKLDSKDRAGQRAGQLLCDDLQLVVHSPELSPSCALPRFL